MTEQREMTLREWVEKLSGFHRARQEYDKLIAKREDFAEGRDHLTTTGTFQSDKYAWCAAGFVPLKLTDPAARDLLVEYARRREPIDAAFPVDLLEALENVPVKPNDKYKPFKTVQETARVCSDALVALADVLCKEQPSDT